MVNDKLMCELWHLAGTIQGLAVGVECIKDIDTMVLSDSIRDCGTHLVELIEEIVKDRQNVRVDLGLACKR